LAAKGYKQETQAEKLKRLQMTENQPSKLHLRLARGFQNIYKKQWEEEAPDPSKGRFMAHGKLFRYDPNPLYIF